VPVAAGEVVAAGDGQENVVGRAAPHRVVAGAAGHRCAAELACEEVVVAVAAVERVHAVILGDVGRATAPAVDYGVAGEAEKRVVPAHAAQDVVAVGPGDEVVVLAAVDVLNVGVDVVVSAGAAVVGDVIDAQPELVGAIRIIDRIRVRAAEHRVIAAAPVDRV